MSAVADAVRADLEALAKRLPGIERSAHAAVALALAAELDHAENSATSKSMCARSLLEAMNAIREMVPPEQKADGLDQLAQRRAARRAG